MKTALWLMLISGMVVPEKPIRTASYAVAVLFMGIALTFGTLALIASINDREPIRIMPDSWTTELVADRPIYAGDEIGITRNICALAEREGFLTEVFRRVRRQDEVATAALHRPATMVIYDEGCEAVTELVRLPAVIAPGRWCLHRKVVYLRLLRLPPSRVYDLPVTCFTVAED